LGISIYHPDDKGQQDAIRLKYRVAAKGVLRVFCPTAGGYKKSPGISRALFLFAGGAGALFAAVKDIL
jgi:hypothetical protein